MADIGENKSGNEWAKATFIMTIVSVVLFAGVVFVFVLRGGW